MDFTPNYRHFVDVMRNRRPARLPLYEHIIDPVVMEQIIGTPFAGLREGDAADLDAYFDHYCAFFCDMTYDVVTFEMCITHILPDSGALLGGRPGPIQSRADFDAYPWADLPRIYWEQAAPMFDALQRHLPPGMKAVGGVGNGVFEISEDLVGLEYLPFMQVDDPDLYAEVYAKIGDVMVAIWREFLARYADDFCACRIGDDFGHKTSLLTNPRTLRQHVFPQYKRLIDQVHAAGRPFLMHSCGCIFEVMEDMLALGIDAKHSNEDGIAPFSRWIEDYGDRIGLLGGFDMDFLCTQTPDEIRAAVIEQGARFRETARGYALGSGNSIPDYVPAENYLAIVEGARRIRHEEMGQ